MSDDDKQYLPVAESDNPTRTEQILHLMKASMGMDALMEGGVTTNKDYQKMAVMVLNDEGLVSILEAILAGLRPIEICKALGIRYFDFMKWIEGDSHRSEQYKTALRAMGQSLRFEALDDINVEIWGRKVDPTHQNNKAKLKMSLADKFDPVVAEQAQVAAVRIEIGGNSQGGIIRKSDNIEGIVDAEFTEVENDDDEWN